MGIKPDTDVQRLEPETGRSLFAMLGEDREALAEIVDAFVEDAPALLAELRRGVEQGDAALAQRAAHSLKSGGLTFGATGFAELCRQAENAARGGEAAGIAPLMAPIEEHWHGVRAELVALRDHGPR
jgi:HPt (histidine-containing phosphotransfer) domain-containing protein